MLMSLKDNATIYTRSSSGSQSLLELTSFKPPLRQPAQSSVLIKPSETQRVNKLKLKPLEDSMEPQKAHKEWEEVPEEVEEEE